MASPLLDQLNLAEPVHLMGAGGAGMSALGELLIDGRVSITACDRSPSSRLDALAARGVPVWVTHGLDDHVRDAGTVIHTAAVPRDHPELLHARRCRAAVLPRSVVIGRLTRLMPSVCVAGSHGKSTVTALLAHILECDGREPGYLVGGVLRSGNRGGCLGAGTVFVVETDEFDRTIERVRPHLAVVTNVEPEHLDVYGTLVGLTAAFGRFARRSQMGAVVWNKGEAPTALSALASSHVTRCGMGDDFDVSCVVAGCDGPRFRLTLRFPDGSTIACLPTLPGLHNAHNATLAAAAAWRLGASLEAIREGLASYPGLERRFELLGTIGESVLVTDYAHHPTEIRATLATARALGQPVLAVFQPHLYSRTAQLFTDFARSFVDADRVILTPIYAAREKPVPGITSETLADAVRATGTETLMAASWEALQALLGPQLGPPLTVLFLAAGDLDGFARGFFRDARHNQSAPR